MGHQLVHGKIPKKIAIPLPPSLEFDGETAMVRKQSGRFPGGAAFDKMNQKGMQVNYDVSYFMSSEYRKLTIFEDEGDGERRV